MDETRVENPMNKEPAADDGPDLAERAEASREVASNNDASTQGDEKIEETAAEVPTRPPGRAQRDPSPTGPSPSTPQSCSRTCLCMGQLMLII